MVQRRQSVLTTVTYTDPELRCGVLGYFPLLWRQEKVEAAGPTVGLNLDPASGKLYELVQDRSSLGPDILTSKTWIMAVPILWGPKKERMQLGYDT